MGWIGFDVDKTLAEALGNYIPGEIGAPIEEMVDRLLNLLYQGTEIRIFTARVHSGNPDREVERQAISDWCSDNIGFRFPITAEKDSDLLYFFDDKGRQVVPNTGEVVGE